MSALPPEADIRQRIEHVCFVPLADTAFVFGAKASRCCAAGTDELHRRELEIINMIYCHVLSFAELREVMKI
jgi:biuret amidohydrolase